MNLSIDDSAAVALHNLSDKAFLHDDYDYATCACRRTKVVARPPVSTGDGCMTCGGLTVWTGTCKTCTSCGTSGGCG